MEEIIADNNFVGVDCPACKKRIELGDKLSVCQLCGVAYHKECWDGAGKCTNPYCSEGASDAGVMAHSLFRQRMDAEQEVESVHDNMLAAVLALGWCLPCAIIAIHYASKVNAMKRLKNYNGAIEAANKVEKWIYISMVGPVIFGALWFLISPASRY